MEKRDFLRVYRDFMDVEGRKIDAKYLKRLKEDIRRFTTEYDVTLDALAKSMRTAMIAHREISLGHHSIEAILLYTLIYKTGTPLSYVEERYGETTAELVEGLMRVYDLYYRQQSTVNSQQSGGSVVRSDNFRKLLISLAQDVRVIMIMIVERLDTMRNLEGYVESEQQEIAREVSYLYAPLAHRMGLYGIKTELEDLSLKYTSREVYKDIAHKFGKGCHFGFISSFGHLTHRRKLKRREKECRRQQQNGNNDCCYGDFNVFGLSCGGSTNRFAHK